MSNMPNDQIHPRDGTSDPRVASGRFHDNCEPHTQPIEPGIFLNGIMPLDQLGQLNQPKPQFGNPTIQLEFWSVIICALP